MRVTYDTCKLTTRRPTTCRSRLPPQRSMLLC